MRFDSFAALLAVSNALLGVSAGPYVAKRQEESSSPSITATSTSASASADETTSSTASRESVGLVVGTNSEGKTTTFEVVGPQPTGEDAATTEEASATATEPTTSYTFSRTGQPVPISTEFPTCTDSGKSPFCLPSNESTLYVGKTYFVTWNPDFFPANSTVQVKVQWTNDTEVEAWSSDEIDNSWGHVAVKMEKDWLQGYSMYNLTFRAINQDEDPNKKAEAFDGPMVTLQNEPPRHYPPSPKNSINKEGLIIGLPIGLGFVLVIVVGLFIGMRKNRIIGLGNIMGRHSRGYGAGKSRRQRLGLGKKGAIRLEERDTRPQYNDARGHTRGDSLGSLVSDDGIRPAPGTNHFRDEMQRQRTGR